MSNKKHPEMTVKEIITELEKHGRPDALEGMKRYGINPENAIGVSVPNLRKVAKQIGKNHKLAHDLFATGIHDAMLLTALTAEKEKVTPKEMDAWVKAFYSWDLVDGFCNNLFVYTPYAYDKAIEWSSKRPEYIKRAGFVMMAVSAVHRKDWDDKKFISFFTILKREAAEERNFVKKALNWALRQIGKHNINLNKKTILLAEEIKTMDSRSARWIANDALRELKSPQVQKRLKEKMRRYEK
ncbi:MAG: DNA alkylation repair protein [Ignavibacteria bacterium RBG_13_36_8]|nr:MAG: DNA alkylation repair protein [Ignavibacteria bacterium RBG_13_36_8]